MSRSRTSRRFCPSVEAMNGKPTLPEVRETIIDLRRTYHTYPEISKLTGIAEQTAKDICRRVMGADEMDRIRYAIATKTKAERALLRPARFSPQPYLSGQWPILPDTYPNGFRRGP